MTNEEDEELFEKIFPEVKEKGNQSSVHKASLKRAFLAALHHERKESKNKARELLRAFERNITVISAKDFREYIKVLFFGKEMDG